MMNVSCQCGKELSAKRGEGRLLLSLLLVVLIVVVQRSRWGTGFIFCQSRGDIVYDHAVAAAMQRSSRPWCEPLHLNRSKNCKKADMPWDNLVDVDSAAAVVSCDGCQLTTKTS